MREIEQAERVRVGLSSQRPFALTFQAPDHIRNLFIIEPETFGAGTTKEAQDLLRTLMLAHLVVRHFPKAIETNFKVEWKIFLDKLYGHYGLNKPKIIRGENLVIPKYPSGLDSGKIKIPFANAHSGGLDSIYRVAQLTLEKKSVLIIHLRNLNGSGNLSEALASRNQAEVFKAPYEEIKLQNGTDNTGFDTMRTRDMFLALAVAIAAEPYGVKKVLVEGDMQEGAEAHFSEYAPAWIFFNGLIEQAGLSSQIEGKDAHDIETVGEVLRLEKELKINIIPLVQNCFTAPHRLLNNRNKWIRETPIIAANSSEHWCGSCPKCRRMTLGRIYYRDPRFGGVPKKEVRFFVIDTYRWLKMYPNNAHLISGSFLNHLDVLHKQVV